MHNRKVTARAHSNIALIKYWGKRDAALNLPAVGSISLTLDKLYTTTSVEFDSHLEEDIVTLNHKEASRKEAGRVSRFLDIFRNQSDTPLYASVNTENNFPTGAGLASSASGLAALALAATQALGQDYSQKELSILARQGSGSAARSIYGGFVRMHAGENADGSDSYAEQLFPENYWDIRLLVVILSESAKKIGSTRGMTHTANTSPYYAEWVRSAREDLHEMRTAIEHRDFPRMGELTEYSCLKMHSLAMSARPGILYWMPETLQVMQLVRDLRDTGIQAYFTIDAGPQVKILTLPGSLNTVKEVLMKENSSVRLIETGLGSGAHRIDS